MTKYLLIRHGQTDWNVAKRWQGHADIALNANGLRQAALVAARLAASDYEISAIYSSDLKRAAETARQIGEAVGVEVMYTAELRERDVGVVSGLTREQIRQQYPEADLSAKKGEFHPPEGESPQELSDRMAAAFAEITAKKHDGDVLIVSHGGSLRALITGALGLPTTPDMRIRVGGNTSLSLLGQRNGYFYLSLLNDTSHLLAE